MIGRTIARVEGETLIFTDGTGMRAEGWEDGASLKPLAYADVKALERERMAEQQKAWLRRLQLLELRSITCEERARRRAAARERAERKYAEMPATTRPTRLMVDNLGRQYAMLCGTAELRRCEACGYSWCPNAVIVEEARAARIGPNARPARFTYDEVVSDAAARATGRAEPGDTPENTVD